MSETVKDKLERRERFKSYEKSCEDYKKYLKECYPQKTTILNITIGELFAMFLKALKFNKKDKT